MTLRLLLLMFASCIFAMGCSTPDAEITDLIDIQQQARITIPASASNFHCATDAVQRGSDIATYGRFDLPKADLHRVLAAMPAEEKTKPYDGFSTVTIRQMRQPWWQPEALERKQVANWSMPGYSVNLLIGDSGAEDTVTVYFFNFSL